MDSFSLADKHVFLQIADTAPRAVAAYFMCLNNVDCYGRVSFSKEYITEVKGRSWIKFKNDLKALSVLGILNFYEENDWAIIEMLQPEGVYEYRHEL
jgi:hypothetical protein